MKKQFNARIDETMKKTVSEAVEIAGLNLGVLMEDALRLAAGRHPTGTMIDRMKLFRNALRRVEDSEQAFGV